MRKFLLVSLMSLSALNATSLNIDYPIDVQYGGTLVFGQEDSYYINSEINAYQGSIVIFDKPATISENGALNVHGSSYNYDTYTNCTTVKFNNGLDVLGSVITTGYNFGFDVYNTLTLSGTVTFGQLGNCDGVINILSGNQNAVFNVSELTKINLPDAITPQEGNSALTVTGDGATQLQYMTNTEISSKAWKEEDNLAEIQERLDTILTQPLNMKRMTIKDYEVSSVTAENVQVDTSVTGEITSSIGGFKTIIDDTTKAKCENKGLSISSVEVAPDVTERLSTVVMEAIANLAAEGMTATITDWPPTPTAIAPTQNEETGETKVEINFNIGNNSDDGDDIEEKPTQTFPAQFNFPEPEEGEPVKENKVEINGKVADNVVIALSGNANAVSVKPENMARLDFSNLKDQLIKFIIRSSSQPIENNEKNAMEKSKKILTPILRDDTSNIQNTVYINEETFILGSKDLHFDTGAGNTINFVLKDLSKPFTFKIAEYVVGANSITNIEKGCTLSI